MVKFNPITFMDLRIAEKVDNETGTRHFVPAGEEEVRIDLKSYIKSQIPSARFWLMLKLKDEGVWTNRWLRYINEVKEVLRTQFEGECQVVESTIRQQIDKLERSAWNTMPSAFLTQIGIPRNIRR